MTQMEIELVLEMKLAFNNKFKSWVLNKVERNTCVELVTRTVQCRTNKVLVLSVVEVHPPYFFTFLGLTKQNQKRLTRYFLLSAICFLTTTNSFADAPLPKPLTQDDFNKGSKKSVALGHLLFFDPILSGNKNISCATCHHPNFSTADGVSLSLGEGGVNLGNKRYTNTNNPPEQLIGRNAPALFNLGAKQFKSLFHDGRLEENNSFPNGLRTPLGQGMTGLNSVLSAQALFPIASPDEMAGHYNENEISKTIRKGQVSGKDGAWNKVAQRIRNNEKYVDLFKQSLDNIKQADDIQFTDIANSIADFIAFEWQAVDSPFDQYLKGRKDALSADMKSGMTLFYGKAECSSCHSGALQTDHDFHAIAMPQFGPGKTARFETHKNDTGRLRVTGVATDAYKFRTPSLRNVALTAPYGHSGAFKTLQEIINHHLNPVKSLEAFEISKLILPKLNLNQPQLVSHEEIEIIAQANELKPVKLTESEVKNLEAFLHALTDSNNGKGKLGKPDQVPSRLAFD